MAKKSMIAKNKRPAKFSTQAYTRCERCGRPHSVYRKFKLCRVCFRELAYKGQIPGVTKASWYNDDAFELELSSLNVLKLLFEPSSIIN